MCNLGDIFRVVYARVGHEFLGRRTDLRSAASGMRFADTFDDDDDDDDLIGSIQQGKIPVGSVQLLTLVLSTRLFCSSK